MEMILRLLLRRLMALPVMILGVTALVFVVLQFTPGDPATVALGESASEAAKQLYRESHGLNDPLFVQYFRFLGNLLVLDFGVTMPPELPISSMLAKSFPITLQLTLIGVVFAAVVSFSLGVLAALYRDSWVDQVIRLISVAAVATPSFWLGILLRLVAFWWFCTIQRKPNGVYQFHDFAISCTCCASMCVINSCGAYNHG